MIWRKELLTFVGVGIIFIALALLAPISAYDYYLIGVLASACL
jgi:Na+-transporting methylmalonyl-CoA/oxaloacetate decarboxylase gamma subunit